MSQTTLKEILLRKPVKSAFKNKSLHTRKQLTYEGESAVALEVNRKSCHENKQNVPCFCENYGFKCLYCFKCSVFYLYKRALQVLRALNI